MILTAENGFHDCRRCSKPTHIGETDYGYYLACECGDMEVRSHDLTRVRRQWNRAVWIDSSRVVEIAQVLMLAIAIVLLAPWIFRR